MSRETHLDRVLDTIQKETERQPTQPRRPDLSLAFSTAAERVGKPTLSKNREPGVTDSRATWRKK